jgi:hypothetical protein
MKNYFLLIVAVSMFTVSCHKSSHNYPPPEPPISDARDIQLKVVSIERLPFPYFLFTYNDDRFVTEINFASGFFTWKVQYEKNRVIRMINTFNNDTLAYTYANNKVISIRHTDAQNGKPKWDYIITYDDKGLASSISWWIFLQSGGPAVLNRRVTFAYYDDDNLREYKDYRADANLDVSLENTVTFTNYDDGINVDDFYLLKEFSDDFLFLPQVKWQKNNPRHDTRIGKVNDYTVDYTYQYNTDKLPVVKTYTTTITRGDNSGQQFNGRQEFTY